MKATSKLIGAMAALVIAIAVATGSTFAWFTSNQKVSVDSIDMQVTMGTDGLYVALGKSTDTDLVFKTEIKKDDLSAYTANLKLDALTSTADSNGVKLTKENSTDAVTFNKSATAEAPNQYIEFDLTFRATAELSVLLANDAAVSYVDGAAVAANQVLAWKDAEASVYGTALTAGTKIIARAADAARVAFINGTTPIGKVWAPNESKTLGGKNVAGRGFYIGNLANDYRHEVFGVTPETLATVVATNKVVAMDDGKTYNSESEIVKLTKAEGSNFYQTTVTVKVWLEGTDGDCFNSIYEDKMTVDLKFMGLRDPSVVTP